MSIIMSFIIFETCHNKTCWVTSEEFVFCNITIFYPYRGGIAYIKPIEINKASLSKLRVSFE